MVGKSIKQSRAEHAILILIVIVAFSLIGLVNLTYELQESNTSIYSYGVIKDFETQFGLLRDRCSVKTEEENKIMLMGRICSEIRTGLELVKIETVCFPVVECKYYSLR